MLESFKTISYWLFPEILAVLGFLLALVFVANLLRQKRSPTSTIAWLLVILLLPYVGVPLYLMLGGRKMSRMAGRKQRVYRGATNSARSSLASQAERLLSSYGVPDASAGNRVTLVTDGNDAYRQLMRMIDEARSFIHITTYILGRDEVGQALIDRLRQRVEEGIAVRLLLDDVGSWRVGRKFVAPLIESGAQVAFFMPMLHIPFRGRANLRNHRKLIIVDGQVAMTGGMNLALPYMSPDPEADLWQDVAVTIEGPGVGELELLFNSDWAFATNEDLSCREPVPLPHAGTLPGSAIVQVVASGPDVSGDPFYESLISLIFAATERIWIVTPYFVPDEMLSQALNLAARRGVDVRLIIPRRSNHVTADLARESYLRDLHKAGGRVLLHGPTMLHAKAILFDDRLAVIGSANMDMRSLFLNYEVALFIDSADFVAATANWIQILMRSSKPDLPKPSASRELAENVVRLLAPLL